MPTNTDYTCHIKAIELVYIIPLAINSHGDRHTCKQTDIQTDRQTDTHRHKDTHTHRRLHKSNFKLPGTYWPFAPGLKIINQLL